jgi:hypothetical protein
MAFGAFFLKVLYTINNRLVMTIVVKKKISDDYNDQSHINLQYMTF